MGRRVLQLWAMLAIASIWMAGQAGSAYAQKKPLGDRPIQILVGFPVGGIHDTVNRAMAGPLARQVAVNIVPVPTPGAGGAVAMQKVARATPDGHTLMFMPSSALLTRPLMMGLPISYRDFAPIATVAINFTMIQVRSDHRWKSFNELIKDARANPGKYSYATPGIGGNPHLAMALISRVAGIQVTSVPYQGSPQAIVGLLGKEADFIVTDNIHPQLRPLATLNAKRSPFQPEVPTLRELGYHVDLFARFSYAAPKGTPASAIQALEKAVRVALDDPEVRRVLKGLQVEAVFESAQELAQVWEQQAPVYKRLIEELGLVQR